MPPAENEALVGGVTRPGRIAILGAGPCGLGAAYRLRELGYDDFVVFDRQDSVGGLASSVTDSQGFVWDFGCHVLYSRSDYFNGVMDEVLAGEWIDQPRDAQVWLGGRFVPYPLQYNLHRLSDDLRRQCVLGLAGAATAKMPERHVNFRDWIDGAFGRGIADCFMIPYNEKVWAHPLETMGVSWIAERVPRPDLVRVLTNLLDCKDDDNWGPNARFRYPHAGGTGRIWRKIADRIGSEKIILGRTALQIDPVGRVVYFDDGSVQQFDVLISTIPIDRLVAIANIDALKQTASMLASSTVHVVGLGIEGSPPIALQDRKWIYFPDHDVPFYRMTVLSNFATSNTPEGHWSLLAEVAHSKHRPVDAGSVVEAVLSAAIREGLIADSTTIVSRFHHVAEPGYPTPTLSRDRALSELQAALESLNIFSRGRFGAWRYEIANQDHCFLQGAELAARLVCGNVEAVFLS